MTTKRQLTSKFEGSNVKGNVIENVHVCGLVSANGYTYSEVALKEATTMYEGVQVFIDHDFSEDNLPRSMNDKIGVLEGVFYVEGKGVYAKKLVLNPKHPRTEQMKWWAENYSKQIGLSHYALVCENEKKEVTKIAHIGSVDIVVEGATVSGLFEGKLQDAIDLKSKKIWLDTHLYTAYELACQALYDSSKQEDEKIAEITKIYRELLKLLTKQESMDLKDLTLDQLTKDRPDLVKAVAESTEQRVVARETKIQEALNKVPEKNRTKVFEKLVRQNINDDGMVNDLVTEYVSRAETVVSKPGSVPTPPPTTQQKPVAESVNDELAALGVK